MTAGPPTLLDWTGHPLIDVGIATLCAMVDKTDARALDVRDLDNAAREMEDHYFSGLMDSYLSCVFTMNAAYTNPAGGDRERRRREYAERVLYAHRFKGESAGTGLRCFISGRPATHLLDRRHMPMLTGEGVLNFFPAGLGGLPLHGAYVTALQALPLGGRRSEGKLLVAHSDDPALTLAIARRFLADNRRLLNLGKAGGWPLKPGESPSLPREVAAGAAKEQKAKYPDAKGPQTLVVNDLMELWEQRSALGLGVPKASLTVYLLSNSGQGPSLELWYMPCNLLRFLFLVVRSSSRLVWSSLIEQGWRETPSGSPGRAGVSANRVINDLIRIYEPGMADPRAAAQFVQHHLLASLRKRLANTDAFWELTELFLREVLTMDDKRISAIKNFADTLASYVDQSNDQGLLKALLYADSPLELRRALVRADREMARSLGQPLFTLDQYLDVFEAEHQLGYLDWALARDLIAIRVLERLCESGYLSPEKAREVLQEEVSNTL